MKIMWTALLLLVSACVIVVEEDDPIYHDAHSHEHESRACTNEPYSYAPDFCDVGSTSECCEWYVGQGCYETWCYYYHDNECDPGWRIIYSECYQA